MNGPHEARRMMPDDVRIKERTAFAEKLLPHVGPILTEDGYMRDVLKPLNDDQQSRFFSLIARVASLQEFGRLESERRLSRTRSGPRDLVVEGHKRILVASGMDASPENLGMIEKVAETVIVAYNNDFSLH